jgi:hypothetical protein
MVSRGLRILRTDACGNKGKAADDTIVQYIGVRLSVLMELLANPASRMPDPDIPKENTYAIGKTGSH